jgi:hypothetical protein
LFDRAEHGQDSGRALITGIDVVAAAEGIILVDPTLPGELSSET